jgi:predicted TIM-barrel fold metal-dependent hydrolase
VQLPNELNTLLLERERAYGNKDELTKLFTEDSVHFSSRSSAGIRGRQEVASFLAELFARPYKVTPVAFAVNRSTGYIAGYLSRGEGTDVKHFANIIASIKKDSDGKWKIAAESLTLGAPSVYGSVTAEDLIALLDEAGIQRAVVLSLGYALGDPDIKVENEFDKVQAENNWTAEQVSRFPDRLVGFCGINPLKEYALQELNRCAKELKLSGLKLHFGNSNIDIRNAEHLEKVRQIFRAANELRLPIVAHIYRGEDWYGRETSEIFLKQILTEAPDVVVQIAHMAGAGPGYNSDEALAVFADAISAGNPVTKNLYFDVTTVVTTDLTTSEIGKLIAKRIRQIGVERILYGSDLGIGGNVPPRPSWGMFRALLPLTDEEFKTIANNIAPYLR